MNSDGRFWGGKHRFTGEEGLGAQGYFDEGRFRFRSYASSWSKELGKSDRPLRRWIAGEDFRSKVTDTFVCAIVDGERGEGTVGD